MSKTREEKGRLPYFMMLLFKGFCMGASDVVPGVSGGTVAFILGIYEDLLNAIKSFDAKAIDLFIHLRFQCLSSHVQWKFLASVLSGILLAVFTMARLISWLLLNRPIMIWSFFFGLVIGSIFIVVRQVRKWSFSVYLSLIVCCIAAFYIVGLVPVSTPDTPWYLFLSGAIAICAMILPGISGSFILVILGKYQFVLEAVNRHDFVSLSFVAAGACVGLVMFVRLLSLLFSRYHDLTVAALTGLMLGSLRKVWPWKGPTTVTDLGCKEIVPVLEVNMLPPSFGPDFWIAIFFMALGFFIVLLISYLSDRKMALDEE